MTTWSAPVRYAEVDGQGVVFNAHYLLYSDEAMSLFCAENGLGDLAEQVRLVTSTLTWTSGARWGDVISVDVEVLRLGRTSFALGFEVRGGARRCCRIETTYVSTGPDGRPTALSDAARLILQPPEPDPDLSRTQPTFPTSSVGA